MINTIVRKNEEDSRYLISRSVYSHCTRDNVVFIQKHRQTDGAERRAQQLARAHVVD